MKTCPICNAKAFDDMDVCYGCLHRFDEKRPFASSCDAESAEDDGTSEKILVINVPLPQGTKGVRVAVDFDVSGDPCA